MVQKWIKEFDAQEGTEEGNGGGETEGPNGKGNDTENGGSEKAKTRKPRGGPPEHYFTSLYKDITVSDQRLIRLTYELANNNMKDRPAAGTLLIRALIESSIIYRIKKYKLDNDLNVVIKKTYQTSN